MSQYFLKLYESFVLSNCATKDDLKNTAEIDTSKSAVNSDLGSLKDKIDKLDIQK